MGWKYLAARAEILALGVDTLVVVNVVLPAVLGPGRKLDIKPIGVVESAWDVLVLLREASVVTCNCRKC